MLKTYSALLFCLALFLATPVTAQSDTLPPFLQCKSQLVVTLQFPCFQTLWATDLIDSVADNTPGPVEIGIRKACTGTGFPENKLYNTYTSNEWGFARAEVWARDAAGNTSSCVVDLNIYDTSGSCDPTASIRVQLPEGTQDGIDSVRIHLSGANCLGDTVPDYPFPIITANEGWWMTYGGLVTPGFSTVVLPSKNINPTNGISTFDLLGIQKHILGNVPLGSPYKILAADVNLDGKVSTLDILLLQKLLLGKIDSLPHGQSWRFLPGDYKFPEPTDPFNPLPPTTIVVPNTLENPVTGFHFYGIKIGDVNSSADPTQ